MAETVLIVDNDPMQLRATESAITHKLGYRALTSGGAEEAIRQILSGSQIQPDLVLLDMATPADNGVQVVRTLRAYRPQLPIIVLTRYGDDAHAMLAAQAGADDFLAKPLGLERLSFSIRNALRLKRMSQYIGCLERTIAGHASFDDVICESRNMKSVLALARQASASSASLWIEGERGTGKELLARAIHGGGKRAGKPFVVFDAKSAPDDDSLHRMLFGEEGKHFTLGKLREANRGTLLVKNIAMLSKPVQRRLFEAMLTGRAMPCNAAGPVTLDIRVIYASSEEARSLLAQDRLHTALHDYCKNALIAMPPLRERRIDIPLLSQHFLLRFSTSENRPVCSLSEQALQLLCAGSWPGNVRQLSNLLWRAVMVCDRTVLDAEELRLAQRSPHAGDGECRDIGAMAAVPVLLDMQGRMKKLKSIEAEVIRFALGHAGGCMTRAARSLGIGRSTLYRRVNELGMDGYVSRANHTTRPIMEVSSVVRS